MYSGTRCTQQCPVGFIVNSRGVCSPGCRSNQVEFEGECLDQVLPGSSCMVNAQCMGGASCQNGICHCPRGMASRGSICVYSKHLNLDRTTSILPVESAPGASCSDGQQCTGGSFCSNGNCTCAVDHQIINGACVPGKLGISSNNSPLLTPTVPPNSPCNPSSICGGGSTCLGGVCACPTNQLPVDGKCQAPAAGLWPSAPSNNQFSPSG